VTGLRRGRRLALSSLVAALAFAAGSPPIGGSRDVLWSLVSDCVDPGAASYCTTCRAPIEGTCGGARGCRKTLDVWVRTPEYVAIRDIKMCGCPDAFVHGLALPRARVTGIEDPRRPEGIWRFAWNTARTRIADDRQIALVVNPPGFQRTQDQLHVHLVRFLPAARAEVEGSSPTRIQSLDEVWAAAARQAAAKKLSRYGLLVARADAGDGFLVLAGPDSPEDRFTAATCRPS
jgi:CDP-diacylglycerol pyrophosphatase